MFRGLQISPPLADGDLDIVKGVFHSVSSDSKFSFFRLGRDPSVVTIQRIFSALVEKQYSLYLNAITNDDELGYYEYFGFNENFDWSRPTCDFEDVRIWTDVEHFNESMFELLSILHDLSSNTSNAHARAKTLRSRMTPALASKMFDECHQIHSKDLHASDELHEEPWRKNMGLLATILLRAIIPNSMSVKSKAEEYLLSQYHFHESLLRDDEFVRNQAIGIAGVAEIFGSKEAAGFLFPIVHPDILPALCDSDVVVQSLFLWAYGNVSEGCGSDQLADLFGGIDILIPVMPKLIRVALKDGDQVGLDVVHSVSADCRKKNLDAFLEVTKTNPELLEMAETFETRIANNNW